ncbi:MAG: hypothetical protein JXR71_07470 [Bacteroidales bacterium]|nr:hypothetical protein [Bacteroidales bacterium]
MKTKIYIRFAKTFLLSVFLLAAGLTHAQDSYILYGIRTIPQSTYLNPATNPNANFFLGFPGLSQVQAGIINSLGSVNDIVHKKAGTDSLYLDLKGLINSSNTRHFIGINVAQDLLFAGFRANKTFISFGLRQRLMVRLFMDNDLLKLLSYGDATGTAQYDLSRTFANEDHFLDYHVGVSIPVTEKIRAGARVHLYQGMSNIHMLNNNLKLATTNTANNFELQASTSILINTSGLPDSTGFGPDYMLNFKNFGVGIDLGVEVQVNKQLKVSASLLDLGSIKYTAFVQNFQSNANNVVVNGNTFDFTNGNNIGDVVDSLKQYFNFQQTANSYSAALPTRLLVGAEYLTKDHQNHFSFLFSGRFYHNYMEYASSLSFSRNFSKHITFKASYTYIKDSPFNLGAALSFQFRPFQLYLYSDNIFGVKWDQSRYVQAGFGINFVFPPKAKNTTPDNPGY